MKKVFALAISHAAALRFVSYAVLLILKPRSSAIRLFLSLFYALNHNQPSLNHHSSEELLSTSNLTVRGSIFRRLDFY